MLVPCLWCYANEPHYLDHLVLYYIQEVIDRVRTLQEEGVLTGVMDDRGKFIYITQEEYEAVAKFIKQRGRVSIAELSESINQVICMDCNKEKILIQSC